MLVPVDRSREEFIACHLCLAAKQDNECPVCREAFCAKKPALQIASIEKVSSTSAGSGRIAIVRSRDGGAWKAGKLPLEPMYGAVWEGLGEEV
ncbi:enoylreductase-like protein [Paraphaeosphaeria sporulosa]